MKAISLLSLAAALVGLSCSSPVAGDNRLEADGPIAPLVTGLVLTDETGGLLAVWGNPSGKSQPTLGTSGGSGTSVLIPGVGVTGYVFSNPAPNPSSANVRFSFSLPQASEVRVWIVRARLVGSGPDVETIAGATVPVADMTPVAEILHGQLQPGSFQQSWDAKDAAGVPVPPGFYRVFFQTHDYLLWHDILFFHVPGDLPPGIRRFIFGS